MKGPTIEAQIDFYDRYWTGFRPFSSYKISRVAQILLHLRELAKNFDTPPEILDSGCGDGRCVAFWNEIGPSTGLDLSAEAVAAASKRYPYLKFYSGDATKTAFPEASFDIIISQEVLEHILDQEAYLTECRRLLKPGGFLILTTPNLYYFNHTKQGNYSNQPIENLLLPKQLVKLVRNHFQLLKTGSLEYARGDYGIYRLFSNKFLVAVAVLLHLDGIRKYAMNRLLLGVHICLVARKKTVAGA